jgi:hypothetical protein
MADFNPSRLGQINQAGADNALWLKIFAGEILTAFARTTQFTDRHMIRGIEHGTSAQFPAMGRGNGARYHTPGTQLVGTKVNHAEVTINIDDLLLTDRFIANVDELKNHYDVRKPYADGMGEELAQAFDNNVARCGILAARSNNVVNGGDSGSIHTAATAKTDAQVLAGLIFEAQAAMDERFIPESERNCFVKPVQYNLLVQGKDAINKDWGGSGAYSEGTIYRIGGANIVKATNLPVTNYADGPAKYRVNASTTAALLMHPSAVGTVKLLDLAMESEYKTDFQGTLFVAKYLMGHGVLRPEAAAELRTGAPA